MGKFRLILGTKHTPPASKNQKEDEIPIVTSTLHKFHHPDHHHDPWSWLLHASSPANTEGAAPGRPCPSCRAGPEGPGRWHGAATQEGSCEVRDKGTAGPILCLMRHKVPSAQRALANERHCPECKQAGKGSVFKESVLHFNEDFFPLKSFNIHTKLSLRKGDISSLIYLLLNI